MLYDRLLLLTTTSSGFFYVVTCVTTSLLFITKWYSIVWTYHIFQSFHQLMDILVVSMFRTLQIMLWIFVYKFLHTWVFSSLGYVSRNGITWSYDNSLTFYWNAKLFSKVTVPFYDTTSRIWVLHFIHLSKLAYYVSFILVSFEEQKFKW